MYFTSNDVSQNVFGYQQTFKMVELKKDKAT